MNTRYHEHLRELFGEVRSLASSGLDALGDTQDELITLDETALRETTYRLQQVVAELVAMQDAEAR